MKHFKSIALFVLLAFAAAPALASEALPELQGAWSVETMSGRSLPDGFEMTLTFVDEGTLKFTVVAQGHTREQELAYSATADGEITIISNPDVNPQGDKGNWAIDDDGKLTMKGPNGRPLVMSRQL